MEMTKEQFEKHMKKLTRIPEGFIGRFDDERIGWGNSTMLMFIVESADKSIQIKFDQYGGGHTNFDCVEDEYGRITYRTFDRRGVEDSFYHAPLWDGDKERYNLNRILAEQIERIAEHKEYLKTALTVPEIGHTVQPEILKRLKEKLSRGESINFMPSGFGVGYEIRTKQGRFSQRASHKLEQFFERSPLFVTKIECD